MRVHRRVPGSLVLLLGCNRSLLLPLHGAGGAGSSGGAVGDVGARCLVDGSCQVLAEVECADLGGNYLGSGTVCEPDPCAQPVLTGACCADDGTCQVLTEDECVAASGTYQGDDSSCEPNPCAQPVLTGACCADDGTCQVVTEDECATAGGTYLGDSTTCDPNPCGGDDDEPEGCGLGWWKNHTESWEPTGHAPEDAVSTVFDVPGDLGDFGNDTLMGALRYGGGSGASGAAKLLLRTAVTAALNAAHPEVNCSLSEEEIAGIVNEALASGDRREMQDARHAVGESNGGGCPLE